jgi:HPt (histidine-containing phosphotransfer) domain-containing protein
VPAICNLGIALNRLGGNRDLLRDLIRFFADDAPNLLGQIETGIQQGNARQVQLAAHSLVGLSANFEALPCKALAAQVDAHARDGNLAAAAERYPELEASVQALLGALGIPPKARPSGQSDAVESPPT